MTAAAKYIYDTILLFFVFVLILLVRLFVCFLFFFVFCFGGRVSRRRTKTIQKRATARTENPMSLHFCIVAVSFINGGNRSTPRKPSTCRKSLTNFIT